MNKLYKLLMDEYFWWWVTVAVVLLSMFGVYGARAECLSQRAARNATPDAHLIYSGRVEGHKGAHCWYADSRSSNSPRAAAQSRPPRRSPSGLPGRTAGSIPATGAIPRDGLTPDEGRRLADFLLPLPSFNARFGAAYPD